MNYQIAIFSADAVFARMLEVEFLLNGRGVLCAPQPLEDVFAELVILDLDSCAVPAANTYQRLIGFTADSALVGEELLRKCSMIFHRPFEVHLLRQEVLSDIVTPVSADVSRKNAFRLDKKKGVLVVDGEEISLTPHEISLLQVLLNKRGEVVSRQVLSAVIGDSGTNKVDVYVCYLRKKLEQVTNRRMIKTVRNRGYQLL